MRWEVNDGRVQRSHGSARLTSSVDYPREQACRPATAQMLFFKAETGKAFTIFFAGFAFTITTFPKISRLPAFWAVFSLVLIMQSPGSVNLPVLTTSFVAMPARLSIPC